MPAYYNPYAMVYPASYNMNPYNMYGAPQNQVMPQNTQKIKRIEWVQGEIGATAFQQPPDLEVNQPIPLWDSNDTVIYMKSWGPMGIPNPMQVIRYTLPQNQQALPSNEQQNTSGASEPVAANSNYVTKDDLEAMKNDIRNMLNQQMAQSHNQNGTRNIPKQDNRGEGRA